MGASLASKKNAEIQLQAVRQARYEAILSETSGNGLLLDEMQTWVENGDFTEAERRAEDLTPDNLNHLNTSLFLISGDGIRKKSMECATELRRIKQYMTVEADAKVSRYALDYQRADYFAKLEPTFTECSSQLMTKMREDLGYPLGETNDK